MDAALGALPVGFGLVRDIRFDRLCAAVYGEMIGFQRAADKTLAKSIDGINDDLIAVERRGGIARKGDPGHRCRHHFLDDDGYPDVADGQSLLLPVGEGPFGEARGPAAPDRRRHRVISLLIEERRELAGKGGGGRIFVDAA